MFGIDPYLVDRTKEYNVGEAQQAAEEDRLQAVANEAQPGRLAKMGQRLLLKSAAALTSLGAWLENQAPASEQPLDGPARPTT